MKQSAHKTVAILGTRYGNLTVEQRMLGPLGIKLVSGKGQNEEEIIEVSRGAQVLLCGGAPKITATVIRQLPELRAVVRCGIGVDTVDLAECTKRGIYVANVPDYCVEEVATHALAFILTSARKIAAAQTITRSRQWDLGALKPLQSPRDLVLGVVGFGRIAQSLCRMARAVGFTVWATDPYMSKSAVLRRGAQRVSLRRLIRGADFISLHLPLTSKTRHIMDAARLQAMKPTAYLVNTARGELIDEPALERALNEGWIAGAALDVMEREPPVGDHPLRSMANVVLTPHCAWYTERSQQALREKACAEAIRVLRGGIPKNIVNKKVLR